MLKVVATYKMRVPLRLPSNDRVLRKFNKHHIGREDVPFDEEWPESKYGYKMQDLHSKVRRTQIVEVNVLVLEDGTLVIDPAPKQG